MTASPESRLPTLVRRRAAGVVGLARRVRLRASSLQQLARQPQTRHRFERGRREGLDVIPLPRPETTGIARWNHRRKGRGARSTRRPTRRGAMAPAVLRRLVRRSASAPELEPERLGLALAGLLGFLARCSWFCDAADSMQKLRSDNKEGQ